MYYDDLLTALALFSGSFALSYLLVKSRARDRRHVARDRAGGAPPSQLPVFCL